MISHGHTADNLLYSTIVSIPKDLRASLCFCSENYRGIAPCCSICKLLDMVIIDMYSHYLYTSDLQFGFKNGLSTTMCTAVYIETVQYYLSANTDVYRCLLDASKAFDKVHYDKLFRPLISRGLPFPPLYIYMYLMATLGKSYVCLGIHAISDILVLPMA